MSADSNNIVTFFFPYLNQAISAPIMLVASVILLYFQIKCGCSGTQLASIFIQIEVIEVVWKLFMSHEH